MNVDDLKAKAQKHGATVAIATAAVVAMRLVQPAPDASVTIGGGPPRSAVVRRVAQPHTRLVGCGAAVLALDDDSPDQVTGQIANPIDGCSIAFGTAMTTTPTCVTTGADTSSHTAIGFVIEKPEPNSVVIFACGIEAK